MPQISPMNWVIIILLFILLMTSVETLLPKFNAEIKKVPKTKTTSKKLSW